MTNHYMPHCCTKCSLQWQKEKKHSFKVMQYSRICFLQSFSLALNEYLQSHKRTKGQSFSLCLFNWWYPIWTLLQRWELSRSWGFQFIHLGHWQMKALKLADWEDLNGWAGYMQLPGIATLSFWSLWNDNRT